MRENRTHGSEGGDGESRFRPLSIFFEFPWIPGRASSLRLISRRLRLSPACRSDSKFVSTKLRGGTLDRNCLYIRGILMGQRRCGDVRKGNGKGGTFAELAFHGDVAAQYGRKPVD